MNIVIRYSGSKIKYVQQLNKLVNMSNATTYVEPFLGSGALFLNLKKKFDKYIVNDIDRNVIRIFKSLKEMDYEHVHSLYSVN